MIEQRFFTMFVTYARIYIPLKGFLNMHFVNNRQRFCTLLKSLCLVNISKPQSHPSCF